MNKPLKGPRVAGELARRSRRPLGERARRLHVAVFALLTLGASPATKPSDTVEIAAPPVHATFRVPKLWTRRDVAGLPADRAFLFDPAPPSKTRRPTMQQLVEVMFAVATAEETTPAVVGDHSRAQLLKHSPGIKFTKDAATTFAGHPAWTLQWTETVPLLGPPGKDGKPQKLGSLDVDRVNFVWPDHGSIVHVGLHADTRFMPSLLQKATPVAKSVAWGDEKSP